MSSSFLDFDADGDGKLNGSELRSVLDEAGFAPPPPQQVIAAYEKHRAEKILSTRPMMRQRWNNYWNTWKRGQASWI